MPYTVDILPEGQQFTAAADESLLTAAERAGMHLPFGCRNGSCGACRARLLDGQLEYPDPPQALSEMESAAGLVLLCQAQARSKLRLQMADRCAVAGQTLRTLPARIVSRRKLTTDVLELVLELPRTERLDYLPGQYLDILLKGGGRRSFSIANAPRADGRIELHLRLVADGRFTPFAFAQLQERSLLRFEAPLGSFFLRDHAGPAILVAGGTGLAPLKAMIESELGARRDLHLYWGARSRPDLYLHDWVRQRVQGGSLRYTPVLSEPGPDGAWNGATGLVHSVVAADYPDLSGHDVYMSGPPAMIQAGKRSFFAQGLDPERLYYDSFDYAFATWGGASAS